MRVCVYVRESERVCVCVCVCACVRVCVWLGVIAVVMRTAVLAAVEAVAL